MKSLIKALLFNFLLIQSPLFAWGKTGHRVVGEVAQKHLSPIASEKIKKLLNGRDLSMVSNWCDHIKSFKEYEHTFWWHFINIPDGQTYKNSVRNPNGDIIEAIQRFSKDLENEKLSSEKREVALKWLVHLLGDIHQPLHAGRTIDQGGNLILVKWFNEDSNLHEVWDSKIIDHQKLSYTELTKLINFASVEEIEKWQDSDVHDWLNEALEYRKKIYKSKRKMSYEYHAHSVDFINEQLLKGGIRLAGLLNELLD